MYFSTYAYNRLFSPQVSWKLRQGSLYICWGACGVKGVFFVASLRAAVPPWILSHSTFLFHPRIKVEFLGIKSWCSCLVGIKSWFSGLFGVFFRKFSGICRKKNMAEGKKHKVFLRWTPVDFSQPQINQAVFFTFFWDWIWRVQRVTKVIYSSWNLGAIWWWTWSKIIKLSRKFVLTWEKKGDDFESVI